MINLSTSGVYVNVKIDDWRVALYPGMSFHGTPKAYRDILESDKVQDYCKAHWTEEKLDEWKRLQEELKAEEPLNIKIYTTGQFFRLFSFEQWAAIKQASKDDLQIEYFMDLLRTEKFIRADSVELFAGLLYLVSQKLIPREFADSVADKEKLAEWEKQQSELEKEK